MKPETQTLLSLIITSLTPIVMLWMGFWVRKLEKNTNSIKDALVASTAKASHAEGKVEGKAEQKAENKSGE